MQSLSSLPLLPLLLVPCAPWTTWDEPWHEEVVRASDAFVKVKVTANENGRAVTATVLERLAGVAVPDTIVLDSYYALGAPGRSRADGEIEFRLRVDSDYYLFVARPERDEGWALATPTAGWAHAADGDVIATYRHSCHLARVPESLYRLTQTAIFLALHGQPHDDDAMQRTMREWLQKPAGDPAGDRAAQDLFYCQHAALECFHHFGRSEDLALLEPFLASTQRHTQISAVRALSRIDTPVARERLLAFLQGDGDDFAKVMAVWGLRRLGARECRERLEVLLPGAPRERIGFGIALMDPRIATNFPESVHSAIAELLAEWREQAKVDPQPGGEPR